MTRPFTVLGWLALLLLTLAAPLLAQEEEKPVVYVGQFASSGPRGAEPGFGSSILDELERRVTADGVYQFARWDTVIAKLPSTITLTSQQLLSPCGVLDRQLVTVVYPMRVQAGICGGLEELANGTHRLTGVSWSSGVPPVSEVGPFVVVTVTEATDRLVEFINALPRP